MAPSGSAPAKTAPIGVPVTTAPAGTGPATTAAAHHHAHQAQPYHRQVMTRRWWRSWNARLKDLQVR
jgi:hypothetical protein